MNLGNRHLTDDTLTVGLLKSIFTASGILLEILKLFCFSDVIFSEPIHELQKNLRENIISIEENYYYGGNQCDWVGLDSQFS